VVTDETGIVPVTNRGRWPWAAFLAAVLAGLLVSLSACQATSTPKGSQATGFAAPQYSAAKPDPAGQSAWWNPFAPAPEKPRTPSDFIAMPRPGPN
jgi:hypothetical protein